MSDPIDLPPPDPVSQYAVLIERLRQAEGAKKVHDEMVARTARIHTQKIQQIRAQLEAEIERLGRALQSARSPK
jgi:hypothetical protein